MIQLLYKYRQVIKFGIVGGANFLFSLSLIFLLGKVMGLHYLVVNPIAYLLPTASSFYFNKKWTFKSTGKVKKEGALFFAVIVFAWTVQYFFVTILVEKFLVDPTWAQVAGTFVFTGLNFLGQKLVTFKS